MVDTPDQRYQARGVSAGKEEVHAAIADQDAGLFPGAFCKILPDHLSGDEDACLLVHADGAGTKSSLAYLAWREGFGDEVWRGIAQDSLVMNLDDCACVGALGPFVVSNTIGRNAKRIPGSVIKAIIDGYQAVCDQLADEGISCILAGGETADVGDLVRTIIVDSTICARMGRDEVIDAGRMAPGDVIIGYASTGQARWEQQPNAGIGSNGLTGARHEVLDHGYADSYPETYAPEIAKELVYCGGYRLDAPLPGDDRFTVGSALLSPTRTYLPLIKELLGSMPRSEIHGLIHCSGGAQTKIGKFGSKLRFIKDGLPPVPPLFQLIQQAAGVSWQEMYSVYNMGVRLEVIVPEHQVETCLQLGTACGIPAGVIGRIEESSGPENEVVITSEHGEFHYAQH